MGYGTRDPKKSDGLLGQGIERVVLYRFIDIQKAMFPIRKLCQILSVPESSYHDWHATGRAKTDRRERNDRKIVDQIRRVHAESDETYGYPRVHAELADGGVAVSKRKVASLMKKHDIVGLSGRKRTTTTTAKGSKRRFADLVNRNFHPPKPNTIWYGDITYIWVENQFWYLATVIDACTKQVVGWEFSERIDAQLVTDAMASAVARRGAQASQGCIFHTDQGSQYGADLFTKTCRGFKIRQSMGATGVCFDNAAAESFFATIKRELIDRYRFETAIEMRQAIFVWIETWYNQKRRHSTLGMKTPNQTYTNHQRLKAA